MDLRVKITRHQDTLIKGTHDAYANTLAHIEGNQGTESDPGKSNIVSCNDMHQGLRYNWQWQTLLLGKFLFNAFPF